MKCKRVLTAVMFIALAFCLVTTTVPTDSDAESTTVEVTTAQGLFDELTKAGSAGSGNTVISINVGTLDMSKIEWIPVTVDGYHGADVVTLEGNGCVITGLTAPLFKGGFAGESGIVIRNLTISNSTIISNNSQGSGAFIECVDSMELITLEKCHLKDSTISGSRTGGLIGWTSGYNKVNDGPVDTDITVSGCTVTGCTINGSGSVGGIIGHSGANPATYTTITGCTVSNNILSSTDDGGWRVGAVVGTCNVGETRIIDTVSTENTLSQTGKDVPAYQSDMFGRLVAGDTGLLTIDGVYIAVDEGTLSRALDVDDSTIEIELASPEVKLSVGAWNPPYYLGGESTMNIIIDGNGNKLNIVNKNTDWNYIRCTNDDCVVTFKNMDITNSGSNNGPWNRHDIRFYNTVILDDVHSDKAIALDGNGTLKNVTIVDDGKEFMTDSNKGAVYLLWIRANGNEVSLQNCTLGSKELTNDTRGIIINDQYLKDEVALVTLDISNSKIVTNNAMDPAILVVSTAGANISIRNLDTTGVASGEANVVALDKASIDKVDYEIPLNVEIITDDAYDAEDGVLDEGTMDMIFGDVESQESAGESDITITVDTNGLSSVTLPTDGFEDAPDFTMDIVTDAGTVSVPSSVMAGLDGTEATVSMESIALPPEYSYLPMGSVAYDVSILIDDAPVHDLGGKIVVNIDASLPSRVIHILGNGLVEYPAFGIDEDGKLFIELTSLSDIVLDYTVDDDEEDDFIPTAPSTGSGDSGDGDDTTLYVACVAAAAVVAVLAILALTTNRN